MQAPPLSCKIIFVNKEQIIENFFRSFRVTLTNSFSYSKNHPYFIKSVESFKIKLEETLIVLSPLKIGVTDLGLMVDGKTLTKAGFYDELARLFHQRKIKSIEIKSGVTITELIGFLSIISMSPKDIFKNGGLNSLLKKQQSVNLIIEELDYSNLLQGGGQECTDIWGYMLKDAAQSNDAAKLNKMADDFGAFIKRSDEKDIIGSEEVCANINEFLTALKDKNSEKFEKCSKEVFLWLLHNKKSLDEDKIAKLRPVFNSLSQEDFSSLLWEGLTNEDSFDALSLQLFSKISENKNPSKIAEGFFNKISQSQELKDNSKIIKKIQDLLSSTQGDQLSAVYHNTLESLIKGISSSGALSFDQIKLKENYRYMVLSMFSVNRDADSLKLTAEILEKELSGAFEDNAVGFLKDLYALLIERKKESMDVCIDLEKKFSAYIENIILDKSLPVEQEFLMEMISSSAYKIDFYLDKIFNCGKTNKQVLILFFRLFLGNLDVFYERLKEKLQDMELISNLVELLSRLEMPESLDLLEYIYSFANELIKLDILKAMRKLKKVDINFLTRQLNTDSFLLRKNIYSVLMLDAQVKDKILDLLFKIPSPFGRKNKFLIENMQIAFELDFIDARKSIQDLSRRMFFWNSELRNKAKQILGEWNVLKG